jgi:multidrug resistance efflux pump
MGLENGRPARPNQHNRLSGMEQRLRNAEADIDTLRATTSGLEREIALMRADLERLRLESEKAAGSKLP